MENISTGERIMKLEVQLKEHCDSNDRNFHYLREDTKVIKTDIEKINEKLEGLFDKADQRYASKRTEQLFYTFLGGMGVYITYKLIDLL